MYTLVDTVAGGADLYIEVDEPDERVLVHGLNIGQVRDAEEQYGRVDGNWPVAVPCCVNLHLGLCSNLLLRRDVLRQHLRRRQHVDRLLVLQDVALHNISQQYAQTPLVQTVVIC